MLDIAQRCGARAVAVEAPWGRIVDAADVARALRRCRKPKLVAVVHAETSTGVWQPLEEIAALARDAGALFVVDTVTSLGGVPVEVDAWGIDACYSGTQKCLSCPPGLAPLTFGPRAVAALRARRAKVRSWYLDLTMIEKYWGAERVYHHTAPISMNYALREALRLIQEEGLEARFRRHQRNHEALRAGLAALGCRFASQEGHHLPTLNCVQVPDGIEEARVRRALLDEFDIEIGGGLGPLQGRVWRIGLMGESSTEANVLLLLNALGRLLPRFGHRADAAEAVRAAARVYAGS
jgi:alanine-glyoxylate transaminase/serine-glyoxylate transaminase/serine-pyruvate transaminase